MIDLTQISLAVITLICSIMSTIFIPYLRSVLGQERMRVVEIWVKIAVEAAEQIYGGSKRGKEKKEYVLDFLKSKGFQLNEKEIENLIESMVMKLKNIQRTRL